MAPGNGAALDSQAQFNTTDTTAGTSSIQPRFDIPDLMSGTSVGQLTKPTEPTEGTLDMDTGVISSNQSSTQLGSESDQIATGTEPAHEGSMSREGQAYNMNGGSRSTDGTPLDGPANQTQGMESGINSHVEKSLGASSETTSEGELTSYFEDGQQTLQTLKRPDGSTAYITQFENGQPALTMNMDANDRLTSTTRYSNGRPVEVENYKYDENGQISQSTATNIIDGTVSVRRYENGKQVGEDK